MRARSKVRAKTGPTTIDAHLATSSPDRRAALERLRRTVRASAPRAEECTSYGIPAFRLAGKIVLGSGAATPHGSLDPGTVLHELAEELEGDETGKRKLVNARIARNAVRQRRPE